MEDPMKPARVFAAAALSLAIATPAIAGPKLAPPQNAPFKVEKAQLAIKSPGVNACPTHAKISGWIFTNKPGPVTYMIVRRGGQVGAPRTITAVKGAGGYIAQLHAHLRDPQRHRCAIPHPGLQLRRRGLQLGAAEGKLQDQAGRLSPHRRHAHRRYGAPPCRRAVSVKSNRRREKTSRSPSCDTGGAREGEHFLARTAKNRQ